LESTEMKKQGERRAEGIELRVELIDIEFP
jgi:hypothetical protein